MNPSEPLNSSEKKMHEHYSCFQNKAEERAKTSLKLRNFKGNPVNTKTFVGTLRSLENFRLIKAYFKNWSQYFMEFPRTLNKDQQLLLEFPKTLFRDLKKFEDLKGQFNRFHKIQISKIDPLIPGNFEDL